MRHPNSAMDIDLVPQQPGVLGKMHNVFSAIAPWNPVGRKNLAYFHQFETGSSDTQIEILPDNCVAFVFVCNDNPRAYLAGPVASMTEETLTPDSTYFVFKPYSLLGTTLAIKEMYRQDIPLSLLFRDMSIVEKINRADGFQARVSAFMDFAKKHLIAAAYNDDFVERMELMICRRRGHDHIRKITSQIGYTDRYCRGRFKDALGISLKTYSDIIRVQNVIRMLLRNRDSVIFDAIFENNYYDQSHLIHIFKKYTNHTPNDFVRKFTGGTPQSARVPTAGQPGPDISSRRPENRIRLH